MARSSNNIMVNRAPLNFDTVYANAITFYGKKMFKVAA